MVIFIYVDDLIITSDSEECISDIKAKLKSKFKISDLAELSYFLDIEIIRKKDRLCLSQRKYVAYLHVSQYNYLWMPMQILKKIKDVHLYRSVIGYLIYVTITRPNVVHVVGVLSQFMQEPTIVHFNVVRKMLRYLKRTFNNGMLYDYIHDFLFMSIFLSLYMYVIY